MKINEQCLPCLINQVIKTATITQATNRDQLYKKVFAFMSEIDFNQTNPEIIGETYRLLKNHIHNLDPYKDIRDYYNELFLSKFNDYDSKINSIEEAVKYAIVGNIIDFNPIHENVNHNIASLFSNINDLSLTINHIDKLLNDIKSAKTLLYLGDNCGEICFDKLLIKRIKALNPQLEIYFGVRGEPVVNDSIEEDAYKVGMNEYATIISNGDYSLGTVLHRTSSEFKKIYHNADVVIAKGQANFESLSEENKNIYFLLMVKCKVISSYIGVPEKSLICLKEKAH